PPKPPPGRRSSLWFRPIFPASAGVACAKSLRQLPSFGLLLPKQQARSIPVAVLLKITQDCCSVMLLRLRRAHCEPLDHSPNSCDLRRVLREVIVASISPP